MPGKTAEATGIDNAPFAAPQHDPTPLTEYTNSYLGIDVVLNQNKVKNALEGKSAMQMITIPSEESLRKS